MHIQLHKAPSIRATRAIWVLFSYCSPIARSHVDLCVCRHRFCLSRLIEPLFLHRFRPRSLRQSSIKKPQPAACLAASVHVPSSSSPSPVDATLPLPQRRRMPMRRPCLTDPTRMDRFIHRLFLSTGGGGGQPCLGLRAALGRRGGGGHWYDVLAWWSLRAWTASFIASSSPPAGAAASLA